MPNERQTEAFVRRHFSTWAPEVAVEEQGSESPRIAKLLRAASKSGAGQGRPDFIVQFRDEPELLAVIECKARTTAHESQTRQAHADYAVDGALNYAAHLNKGFDVLAIAVSGTAKRHRVSHFLHLRSQREAHPIFGDMLLTPEDYLRGYRNDDAKYRQDFGSLQVFIKELNETLHIDRVSEGDRALLISAILIALERPSFMETDYSAVADDLFEQTLHDYSTYLFRSRRLRLVSDDSIEPKYTRLRDPSGWRRFPLTDLFTVSGTTTTPPRDLAYCDPGDDPYVTTQATNNGVGGFYAHATEEGGVVTVDSAVAGYSAFQSTAFSASDHVEKLAPSFRMTPRTAMFLVTILNMEQYRYNYGLKRAQKRLKRESLRLPCTKRGDPDWRHMEQYIAGLRYSANLREQG